MNIREQFRSTALTVSQFAPILQNLCSDQSAWRYARSQDDVHYSWLIRPELKQFPCMIRGMTKIFNLSLAQLFQFNYKQSEEIRKIMNPLMTKYEIVERQPGSRGTTLYRAWFQPPTWFLSRRDFVFLQQTFLYDNKGAEIPVPYDYEKTIDQFILENQHKIQRIVSIARSVSEEELLKCAKSDQLKLENNDVRGFLRVNAWIGDKIDHNTCQVTVLSDIDVGGNVPERIQQLIALYHSDGLVPLKRYLAEKKEIDFIIQSTPPTL
jgi:hypothetical protein